MPIRELRNPIDIIALIVSGLVGFLLFIGLQIIVGVVVARAICQGSYDQQFYCTSTLSFSATILAAASAGLLYTRHILRRGISFGVIVMATSSIAALIALFSFPIILFAMGVGFQEAFSGVPGIFEIGSIGIVSGMLGSIVFFFLQKRRPPANP